MSSPGTGLSPEQPRRFRRRGLVTATRLDEDLMWQTEAGDWLHGEVGDWLVTSSDGTTRTAKDAQFRSTYRNLAGDTWERFGTVLAWQVERETSVQTLEGLATARPGDWLVEAADGSRWPVGHGTFGESYEPVDENTPPSQ